MSIAAYAFVGALNSSPQAGREGPARPSLIARVRAVVAATRRSAAIAKPA